MLSREKGVYYVVSNQGDIESSKERTEPPRLALGITNNTPRINKIHWCSLWIIPSNITLNVSAEAMGPHLTLDVGNILQIHLIMADQANFS